MSKQDEKCLKGIGNKKFLGIGYNVVFIWEVPAGLYFIAVLRSEQSIERTSFLSLDETR